MKAMRFVGAGCPHNWSMYRLRDQVLEKSWLRSAELVRAIRISMSLNTDAGARHRSLPWGMKMRVGLRHLVAGSRAGRRATPWRSTPCGGAATVQPALSQPKTTA
jgi:hypothetical protein